MISDAQRAHYEAAIHFIASRREKPQGSDSDRLFPINRGDLLLLVVLIEQELKAVSPAADVKRLAAIREKLGHLVGDSPEMSKEEAMKFRE